MYSVHHRAVQLQSGMLLVDCWLNSEQSGINGRLMEHQTSWEGRDVDDQNYFEKFQRFSEFLKLAN